MPRKKKTEEKIEAHAHEKKEVKHEEKHSEKGKEEEEEFSESKEEIEEDIKELDKELEKEKKKLLVPLEDYIGCSAHIGTRVITPSMRQYVYRRKADGLAVINTTKIDEKLKVAADFISQYPAGDIIIVCKREAGWRSIEEFSRLTGIRVFTKKYPAGIITNPDLEDFFEPRLLLIVDPWVDKNALNDAVKIHIPIISLCDTNNNTNHVDIVIPCNNKSGKSIGLVFYVLSVLFCKKNGIKAKIDKDLFYIVEEMRERKKEFKDKEREAVNEAVREGV